MNRTLVATLLGAALLASTAAIADVTTAVVDIVSTPGMTQRILYVKPDNPVATIVALPGGEGYIGIADDGSLQGGQTARCFPFARARRQLSDMGIAVALVDAASDGSVYRFQNVAAVVHYVEQQANVPVWVAGGSASTNPAAAIVDGLAASERIGAIFISTDVPNGNAGLVRRPALVVFNPADPDQAATAFYAALTSAAVKQLVALAGGGSASGCSYHTFQGQENEFAATVGAFIVAHNDATALAPSAGAPSRAIEFYNATLDHYFISIDPKEISDLDTGVHPGWARTGLGFNAYATAATGANAVCRFYIPPEHGDSHFFSASSDECAAVLARSSTDPNYSGYVYEAPNVFYIALPDLGTGACPMGTVAVYRLWNNRADSNHRYSTDPAVKAQMIARGYVAEGYGPDSVIMCAPA